MSFHKKIKRYIDTVKQCFDWFNSKKHQKSIFRLASQIIFSLIIFAQFAGPSTALAVNATNAMDNAQPSGSYLLQKTITWGDGTTESVSIDSNGFFIINGVKQRLVGFCDPCGYASGYLYDSPNIAILNKELDYLQGKGVRLYEFDLGAWGPIGGEPYDTILQPIYDHKMLAVPLFHNDSRTEFGSLSTIDFTFGGSTVSSWFAGWLTHVKAFPNVVSIILDNELDVSEGHTYTLANVTAYMDMLYNYAKANTNIPIVTKFGYLNNSAFATTVQNAFLPYSAVPCFDQYDSSAADFTTHCNATYNWAVSKGRNQQLWLTEANYADKGYDATQLTKAMIDAMFAANVSAVFLFSVQMNSTPTAMFFDSSGNPTANANTVLANIPAWQAPVSETPSVTNSSGASNVAATTATLNGNLTSDGGAPTTVSVYWGTADGGTTPASWTNNVVLGTQSVGAFTANLTGLNATTTYYYRCYATNSAGSAWASSSFSFTTSAPAPVTPAVTNAGGATNIAGTTATLNGNLTSDGGAATSITVYWGTTDGGIRSGSWANNVALGTNSVGPFATNITGLIPGITYYYRCAATNSVQTTWSSDAASFTTSAPAPVAPAVTDSTGASNITTTAARLNGELTATGNENPTVHVYWGPADGGTIVANWAHDLNLGVKGAGVFYTDITGLTAGATYYYLCMAQNSDGMTWALSSSSFTTSAPAAAVAPTITAPAVTDSTGASNITTTAATLNGNLTSDGGAATTVSVYWGTTDGGVRPGSWANNVVLGTRTAGQFSTNVTGLIPGITYYYRCAATNSLQTAWTSDAASFSTSAPAPVTPTVTNSIGASNITTTAARLDGELTATGNENPTVHVYWGPADGGTIVANWAHDLNLGAKGASFFYTDITGLTAGTIYYYSCMAQNSGGISWAPVSTVFTTSAPAPPAVTTPTITDSTGASNITTTAATLNGNLTSDGGAASTVSVYWGATDGGTTAASWSGNVAVGTQSVGAFTANLTGLTASTTYYYRCYASNSAGSAWAPTSASFTTSAPASSPVTTPSGLSATPVSATQINLSWTDNSNNETGFKIERKTGAGAFAQIATMGANVTTYSNTTGLVANTTYTYRVRYYQGTTLNSDYSNEAYATTLPPPPPVPVLVSPANGATGQSLTPTLAWNASSGAASYGVQLSTSPTFATTAVNQSGLSSTQYAIASGLSWNTLYYWRANATNTSGSTSAWSAAWVFVTAAGPPPAAP